MIEKVIFTNARGRSIELSNSRPFILQSVEGKGDVEAEIQTQKAPYQDGSSYIDSNLQMRSIILNVSILTDSAESLLEQRQLLASVFNPKLGAGKLVYIKGNTEREIKAVSENVPIFAVGQENNDMRYQKTMINLICPSPFWEDIQTQSYKLQDFVGSYTFPFHTVARFSKRGDSKVLVNNGDVPTPILVEFRGPVVNPLITNEITGEFIKINRDIPIGYKLILDTTFGSKRVDIIASDGTVMNGFHYIDLSSTFFNLDLGDNRISFLADGGYPEVYVSYKQRYLSV